MAVISLSRIELIKPSDPPITGRSWLRACFDNGRVIEAVVTFPGDPLQVAQALDSLALMIHSDPYLNPRS